MHRYGATVCNGKTASIPELMAPKASSGLAAAVAGYVTAAAEAPGGRIPVYIGEGNSISCGGAAGVSDVWAAALWALDTLFEVAAVGIER